MEAPPAPAKAGGMSLMEALALRRSTRLYGEQAVDEETLSTLLWAAFGINRPGEMRVLHGRLLYNLIRLRYSAPRGP
jgi:hypothetical protein